MWLGIYQPDMGLLNGILRAVGLDHMARGWLGSDKFALWAVMISFIWVQTGLPLLNCYASVRAIPTHLFEAAVIDGAGTASVLRYIMIPLTLPGVRVSIFINMLNSLKAFDVIHILTAGGPARSTETMGYFMYQESVVYFKQGYGAAATVLLVLFVLLIAIPSIIDRSEKV